MNKDKQTRSFGTRENLSPSIFGATHRGFSSLPPECQKARAAISRPSVSVFEAPNLETEIQEALKNKTAFTHNGTLYVPTNADNLLIK